MGSKFSADVVVIGGGVIGLTIARALALRGVRDVCLIERAGLGTEASFAAAGMLLPQVEAFTKDDFFTLACRSRDLYPSFAPQRPRKQRQQPWRDCDHWNKR
jgi:glycine oxidase